MDVQWWPMWSNDRKNWWRSRQIAQTTMTRRRPKKLWHYLKLKWVVVHQLIRDIIDAQPSFFMDGPSSIRVSNYQIWENFVGCSSPKWFSKSLLLTGPSSAFWNLGVQINNFFQYLGWPQFLSVWPQKITLSPKKWGVRGPPGPPANEGPVVWKSKNLIWA